MTRVLLPRPRGTDADADATLLRRAGITVVSDPYIVTVPLLDPEAMTARRALASSLPLAALVVTSARALAAFIDFCEVDRSACVFAIGATSAAAARAAGFTDVRVPDDGADNAALARLLGRDRPTSVVIPRSTAAPSGLADALAALGIGVEQARIYSTQPVATRPASADSLAAGNFDAVIVRSGSAARALAHFVPQWPETTPIVAGGHPSAAVLSDLGLPAAAIAAAPDADTVVATTLTLLGGSHD